MPAPQRLLVPPTGNPHLAQQRVAARPYTNAWSHQPDASDAHRCREQWSLRLPASCPDRFARDVVRSQVVGAGGEQGISGSESYGR